MDIDYEILHTYDLHIIRSYAKFEVDGSVRYRDTAINVKWGQKNCPQRLVQNSSKMTYIDITKSEWTFYTYAFAFFIIEMAPFGHLTLFMAVQPAQQGEARTTASPSGCRGPRACRRRCSRFSRCLRGLRPRLYS